MAHYHDDDLDTLTPGWLSKYMNRPTPHADPIVRAFRDKPQARFTRHLLVTLAIGLCASGLAMAIGYVLHTLLCVAHHG